MQPLQPLEEYKESRGFAVQPETQHNETLVNQTQGMIPHQEDCASPHASCGTMLVWVLVCQHPPLLSSEPVGLGYWYADFEIRRDSTELEWSQKKWEALEVHPIYLHWPQ